MSHMPEQTSVILSLLQAQLPPPVTPLPPLALAFWHTQLAHPVKLREAYPEASFPDEASQNVLEGINQLNELALQQDDPELALNAKALLCFVDDVFLSSDAPKNYEKALRVADLLNQERDNRLRELGDTIKAYKQDPYVVEKIILIHTNKFQISASGNLFLENEKISDYLDQQDNAKIKDFGFFTRLVRRYGILISDLQAMKKDPSIPSIEKARLGTYIDRYKHRFNTMACNVLERREPASTLGIAVPVLFQLWHTIPEEFRNAHKDLADFFFNDETKPLAECIKLSPQSIEKLFYQIKDFIQETHPLIISGLENIINTYKKSQSDYVKMPPPGLYRIRLQGKIPMPKPDFRMPLAAF